MNATPTREPLVGLAERLRALTPHVWKLDGPTVLREAATALEEQSRRVEELEAEIRRLRSALQPFAHMPLYVYDGLPSDRFVPSPQPKDWIGGGWFTAGECDTARTAVSPSDTVEKGEGA